LGIRQPEKDKIADNTKNKERANEKSDLARGTRFSGRGCRRHIQHLLIDCAGLEIRHLPGAFGAAAF
jgi:hypothetical protein